MISFLLWQSFEVPSSKYPVGQVHEGGGNLLFPTH
jgi:hypothetical protein